MKPQFTNRHQRQHAKTQQKKEQTPQSSQKTSLDAQRPWYKKRKVWLIAGACVAVLALAVAITVLLWHAQASHVQQEVDKSVAHVVQRTDELEETYSGLSLEERETHLQGLRDAISQVSCGAAHIPYQPLRDAASQCQTYNQHAGTLQHELDTMIAILAYDRTLQDRLTTVMQDTDATAEEERQRWQEVTTSLDELTPPRLALNTHEAIRTSSQRVTEAWQALVAADEAEDSEAYEEAQNELVSAYEELSSHSDTLTQLYEEQQQKTWQEYNTFKEL